MKSRIHAPWRAWRDSVSALAVFLSVALFLLKDVLVSQGLILGSDWGLPLTPEQIRISAGIFSSTWAFNNFISYRNFNVSGSYFFWLWQLVSKMGIYGDTLSKAFLVFCFVLAGFSLYVLLRFLELDFFPALIGGVVYITTPIFFDYAIMGWTFVLLAGGLFPLAAKYHIKAVSEDDWRWVVVAALLFSIGFLQSQSIVWFPLLFLAFGAYLIYDRLSLNAYIIKTGVIIGLFLLLNQHVILNLLISPDKAVSGKSLIWASESLGEMHWFYPMNIIRLFGGLFNYQFETIIVKNGLSFFSFILSLTALGALFVKRYRRISLSFVLISLVPIALYVTDRRIVGHIPFASVIRDFPRFSVLSTFGFSALAAISIQGLSELKLRFRYLVFAIGVLWAISLFPWWAGELTAWKNSSGSDCRLRTYVFPADYYRVENDLLKKKIDGRALYLPIRRGEVESIYDRKFRGAFNEFWDIFAAYSPIPGILAISDRDLGVSRNFESRVVRGLRGGAFQRPPGNLRYVVLRKDLVGGVPLSVLKREAGAWLAPYYSGDRVDVFKVRDFIPHFYVPQRILFSNNSFQNREKNPSDSRALETVLRISDNSHVPLGLSSLEKEVVGWPHLEFRKVAPTKYRIRIHGAPESFLLVFSESFHPGWKVYLSGSHYAPEPVLSQLKRLSQYKILDDNEGSQAGITQLGKYIKNGWVTSLGQGAGDSVEDWRFYNGSQHLRQIRKYEIGFVSKNIHGTIQNDNLPMGPIYETWFKTPLPEKDHLMANGYANSWIVNADSLCKNNPDCRKNPDGTYDMEFVIEFWPQRLFYLGVMISALTLLACLGYWIWSLFG